MLAEQFRGLRPGRGCLQNLNNLATAIAHATSLNEWLQRLDHLGLSPDDKAVAAAHVSELEAETRDEQRWPVIGKTMDALKSMSKSVYKEIAVPLIVEYAKSQM